MQSDNRPKRNYVEDNLKDVTNDRVNVIPWIQRSPDLFEVVEEKGVLNIVVNTTFFKDDIFEYQVAQCNYDRWQDRNYKDSTFGSWRFYVMVNTSPLSDVVKLHFADEVEKTFVTDLSGLYKRIWTLIAADPRSDQESVGLYFKNIVENLVNQGFNKEMGEELYYMIFKGWTPENQDKKTKEMKDSAVTCIGKLMYKIRKLYEEKNNQTLSFLDRKRKQMEERNKPKAKTVVEETVSENDEIISGGSDENHTTTTNNRPTKRPRIMTTTT